MPMLGPVFVDLPGHVEDAGSGATHQLDDSLRVADKHRVVIEVVFGVEQARGSGHRRLEARAIDRDPVAGAALLIAHALKPRTGMDEGEIDVEEDGCGAWHRLNY